MSVMGDCMGAIYPILDGRTGSQEVVVWDTHSSREHFYCHWTVPCQQSSTSSCLLNTVTLQCWLNIAHHSRWQTLCAPVRLLLKRFTVSQRSCAITWSCYTAVVLPLHTSFLPAATARCSHVEAERTGVVSVSTSHVRQCTVQHKGTHSH